MKILLLTQLFNPEPNHLKGLTFARGLVARGHEVEVLACYPNYPGGKIYPGYRQRLYQREVMEGIPVLRVPLYPSHDTSGMRRIACYGSFALSAATIGASLVQRADVVHVYQGPASLAFPAIVLKMLRHMPFIYDIQDLWPDSLQVSGMMQNKFVLGAVQRWCDMTYRQASRIVVLSPGFKTALIERGVPEDKIDIIYNWCEENKSLGESTAQLRDDLGFSGRFVVMYAGSFGTVQALDAVIDAAGLLAKSNPKILLAFMGDGVEKERLTAKASGCENVRFLPRQPAEAVGGYLDAADALLIHLQNQPLFHVTIPQKTQAYLAAGRPIIIGVKGDAADLVARAQAGVACEPENPASIAAAIVDVACRSDHERQAMGERGRDFYYRELSFQVGMEKFDAIFRSTRQ